MYGVTPALDAICAQKNLGHRRPDGDCSESTIKKETRLPYSASYFFYR
jgi:uncharacterized protein YjaG (DUF416 family)